MYVCIYVCVFVHRVRIVKNELEGGLWRALASLKNMLSQSLLTPLKISLY